MKAWHDHCKSDKFDKFADPGSDFLEASKIESYLTGIARIIYYRKYRSSDNFYLTDMMEGEITKGTFEGYARCLEVRFNKCKMSAVQVSCKVGFWKTQDGGLMPNGKWAWFLTNTHNETKMRANDGIYTADKDSRNRVVITRKNGLPLEDFYKNAEIKGSKKINLSLTARI